MANIQKPATTDPTTADGDGIVTEPRDPTRTCALCGHINENAGESARTHCDDCGAVLLPGEDPGTQPGTPESALVK